MKSLKNYKLEGNLATENPYDHPRIGNLVNDELGKHVISEINKAFKDKSNIEITHQYDEGEPISYSNVPRILKTNEIISEATNGRTRGLNHIDILKFWDSIPERNSTYADTNSIVVFPNEGPNESLRKRVLDLTGKKPRKRPLIVSGLSVERSDNDYGFNFIETENMNTEYASWLEQDGFVRHDPKKDKIVSCTREDKRAVRIWVPDDQSGLRGLYRNRSDYLNARGDDLLNSNRSDRVQIFQDPQGCDEK